MKKLLIITLLSSQFATFATDDGSDKIIKKYLKAIGGAKEWEGIKTLQIIRHEDNKSNEYLEKISILRNKGIRNESMFSSGSPNLNAYYENKCWAVMNPQKIRLKSVDSLNVEFQMEKDSNNIKINISNNKQTIYSNKVGQIVDIKDGQNHLFYFHFFKLQIQIPWNFLDYEANGYKATYKRDSKISIDEVSEIEMISQTGDTAQYFFDKKTSLLLRVIQKNIQLDFSSYKKIAKVFFPYEVHKTITDFQFIKEAPITPHSDWYIIDQVKLNEPMDENIFMKPKQ
jgi:hypothetical protein